MELSAGGGREGLHEHRAKQQVADLLKFAAALLHRDLVFVFVSCAVAAVEEAKVLERVPPVGSESGSSAGGVEDRRQCAETAYRAHKSTAVW